jgi:hypothetical protein
MILICFQLQKREMGKCFTYTLHHSYASVWMILKTDLAKKISNEKTYNKKTFLFE